MVCPSCKFEIPDGARVCGHCRSKVPQDYSGAAYRALALFIGFLFFVGVASLFMDDGPPDLGPQPTPEQIVAQAAAQQRQAEARRAAQAEANQQNAAVAADRKAFVQSLLDEGIFSKVDCDPSLSADVWIRAGSSFWPGDFEDKQRVVSVVYVDCFGPDERAKPLYLRHAATGKEAGTFSGVWGLKLE